ncbi:2-hydroxychromene-2-carboxylate isomerase, partial [Burkholderia cenocepacia]|nr:2-hydroxychromene-2-carboxylate isomerase [Burkholderia cenocepacia]
MEAAARRRTPHLLENDMTTGLDTAQPAWFFDFVSPFSYLLLEQHDKWPDVPFDPVAVSLSDLPLLRCQRSIADVPAKRVFTYR